MISTHFENKKKKKGTPCGDSSSGFRWMGKMEMKEKKKKRETDAIKRVLSRAHNTQGFSAGKKKQNIRPKLSPRPMAISFLFSFRIHTPVAVAHSGKSVVPSDE